MKPESVMQSMKKQSITVALDPPDLERVKALAERERSSPSGIIRKLVAQGLRGQEAVAA
jgi:predicted transcriptional regulator